jgi:ComF family protein
LYAARGEPDDPLMRVLHRFKYERDVSVAPVLAAWLAHHCPLDRTYDIVVAVPLHRKRLRWRGFNQAVLLARPQARAWGVAHDPFVLARTRHTAPQVGLDERERRRNIAGAFRVHRPTAVRQRRVLLVDDVYTTGATLEECARVLRRAGARQVDALVLSRAVLH